MGKNILNNKSCEYAPMEPNHNQSIELVETHFSQVIVVFSQHSQHCMCAAECLSADVTAKSIKTHTLGPIDGLSIDRKSIIFGWPFVFLEKSMLRKISIDFRHNVAVQYGIDACTLHVCNVPQFNCCNFVLFKERLFL